MYHNSFSELCIDSSIRISVLGEDNCTYVHGET